MGLKPFFYHRGPRVFLCASEPQALLSHPAVSRRPNEGMVAEYLSVVTSTTDTLWAGNADNRSPALLLIEIGDLHLEAGQPSGEGAGIRIVHDAFLRTRQSFCAFNH